MPETRHHPTGGAVAAMLSAALGLVVLALVQVRTHLNERFKEQVFDLGKSWIPNAEGIGPYSGKETLLLVAWLGSWLVLHLALRKREVPVRPAFAVFLVAILSATVLLWPPVWHWLE